MEDITVKPDQNSTETSSADEYSPNATKNHNEKAETVNSKKGEENAALDHDGKSDDSDEDAEQEEIPTHRIFISGFPSQTPQEEILKFLQKFGDADDLYMMLHPNGDFRGMVKCTFRSPNPEKIIRKIRNTTFGNRSLRCDIAHDSLQRYKLKLEKTLERKILRENFKERERERERERKRERERRERGYDRSRDLREFIRDMDARDRYYDELERERRAYEERYYRDDLIPDPYAIPREPLRPINLLPGRDIYSAYDEAYLRGVAAGRSLAPTTPTPAAVGAPSPTTTAASDPYLRANAYYSQLAKESLDRKAAAAAVSASYYGYTGF